MFLTIRVQLFSQKRFRSIFSFSFIFNKKVRRTHDVYFCNSNSIVTHTEIYNGFIITKEIKFGTMYIVMRYNVYSKNYIVNLIHNKVILVIRIMNGVRTK